MYIFVNTVAKVEPFTGSGSTPGNCYVTPADGTSIPITNPVPWSPTPYIPPPIPCPSCGHCPTCGRARPYQNPPYVYPTWLGYPQTICSSEGNY